MNYPSEIIKGITEFLFIGTEKKMLLPSNLVIVLGNDYIDGTVSEIHDLYKDGFIKTEARIILTGSTGSLNAGFEAECDSLYNLAVKKYCMPEKMFIKENNAKNAFENLLFSRDIIEQIGGFESFDQILIIGYAFALRRISMYVSKLNYPADKIQYYGTVDEKGRNIGSESWWLSDVAINRVMAEIERIGKYYKSGNLGIF